MHHASGAAYDHHPFIVLPVAPGRAFLQDCIVRVKTHRPQSFLQGFPFLSFLFGRLLSLLSGLSILNRLMLGNLSRLFCLVPSLFRLLACLPLYFQAHCRSPKFGCKF
jgi:hypothetical protein